MLYIAVCDDDEYFRIRERQLIIEYLNKKGYKCIIDMFPSGEDIVRLGDGIRKYNAVFLDINMDEI